MPSKNISSEIQELTSPLIELNNTVSTRQISVIDCSNIEPLISRIIINARVVIRNITNFTISEESRESPNLAYLAQLERLRCILELLISKLQSISCSESCPELLEELFCILIKIDYLIILINNARLIPLFLYRDASIFFECLLCDLIEEITDLENLVKDLVCIIIALISCETDTCTPCYVATNSGKRPRPNINVELKHICKK